ncbi:MAG: hypothetical protein ACFFCS_00260 [Candidatus Hodarchaeota archaeon]
MNFRTKISLLIMGFGFLGGGLMAIFYEPVPLVAFGYHLESGFSQNGADRIIIDDVNGDGIDDIFVWLGSFIYEQPVEFVREFPGVAVFSGKDGSLLNSRDFDKNWVHIPTMHRTGDMFRTEDNDVIMVVATLNLTDPGNVNNISLLVDKTNYHLLRIDGETLELEQDVKISDEGWESEYALNDPTQLNPDFFKYRPDVTYVKDMGFNVPGTSFTGDVLVVQNTLDFWNGTDYLDDRTMFFIDPSDFSVVGNVTWSKYRGPEGNVLAGNYVREIGWCMGPTNAIEDTWSYPYFFAEYYYTSGDDRISWLYLTTLDKLDDENATTWIINNQSLWKFNDSDPGNMQLINAYLSLNETGDPTGLTLYRGDNIPYQPPSSGSEITELYWPWSDAEFTHIEAFQLASFNFDESSGSKTFYCEGISDHGKSHYSSSSINGITNTFEEGTCFGIVPIKTNATGQNTSLALVFTDQEVHYEQFHGIPYPFVDWSVFFLPGNYSGVYLNSSPLSLDALTPVDITVTNTYVAPGFPDVYTHVYTPVSIDFDVDGDGLTDIPFSGTSYNEEKINEWGTSEDPVNGPFASVTQAGAVDQKAYVAIQWNHGDGIFLDDMNDDGISDMWHEQTNVVFFNQDQGDKLDFIGSRLADPISKYLFPLGIGLVVASAIMLLVALLGMKKNTEKIRVSKSKGSIVLLVIALVLFIIVYMQIQVMNEEIVREQDKQYGLTDTAIAMANLEKTSNIALITFLIALPLSAGLYTMASARGAADIALMNQRRLSQKPKEGKEKEGDYALLIIPPFNRNINSGQMRDRIITVLTMSITVGMLVFEYGTQYFDVLGVSNIETITGLTDPDLMAYISGIFLYMIIPGIVSIPIFYWLLPTSWLLDDAGVIYYIKDMKSTVPEDVETVSGWFSDKIIGYFGIGAIITYVTFVLGSPIPNSIASIPEDIQIPLLIFVFGFIIVSGFAIGALVVVLHKVFMPYNSAKLYQIMSKRKIDTRRKKIVFESHEKLTPEVTEEGILGRSSESIKEPKDEDDVIKVEF